VYSSAAVDVAPAAIFVF